MSITSLLAWLWAAVALAGPPAAPVKDEIDGLLARLEASGCDVQRNGTWHNAAEAKVHMLTKLEYIERMSTLKSAEQFIDLAASTSSLSGKPYMIRCAGVPPVESRSWMLAQLEALRAAANPKRPQ
ncbi:MAG: DUF5329 domain-containing protein [Burkholderiales bacterium]